MIISFSGIDSSGKGTQIKFLSMYFSGVSVPFKVCWARPGYTPMLALLKKYFFRSKNKSINYLQDRKKTALANNFLSYIWIYISLIDLILYWVVYFRIINKRSIIIADRYILDAYVDLSIQFKGVDISKLVLYRLLKFLTPIPDYSFFLELNPDISIKRQSIKHDRYPVDFSSLQARADLYHTELANKIYSFIVIDANIPAEEIELIIRKKLGI